ncbi:MAG TPA: PBP1A family penicillin-binding protein [Thermoanaerobaculia bacterium]|nr:PBP1A family penicillin-binding protein [Thermoanaerobaculia bacterium]
MTLTERFPRLARVQEWLRRHKVLRITAYTALAFFVIFLLLGIYVYRVSVKQFEVRRLSLPTRVYADYTPLQPGLVLQQDDLLEKLDRLGYRESSGVAQPGEFALHDGVIDIHTRPFKHPSGDYPAQAVRIVITKSQIESVVSFSDARPVDHAALEPELLTSILGETLENRRPVTLDQVPQHLQDAVVVTEDVRFWHHPGVDPWGILRASLKNMRGGGARQGASTLTQQLVKNYYLTSERTYRRKIVEAFMAVILDFRYSKRDILEAYLNDIYLGRNRSISILGVGEASRFYFGKPVSEINVAEAAMLAGMIKSPNNYSPFNNPERAMRVRNITLGLMLKEKKIDQATYEKAHSAPLPRKPFREKTGLTSIPYYVDRVLQEMARDYGIDDVKGRGLQIYTAIDLGAQDTAAKTLDAGLRNLEKNSRRLRRASNPLQGALIHVDIPTGEIRALVGGRNYELSQFNRALNSKRLVGSLFKPFVYLTAFEPSLSNQNITPATIISDTRFVLKRRFAPDWSPRNDDAYHGNVTVRQALEMSLNSASVRIGLACGIEPILKTAHTLGVQTELDDNPAVILGAVGIPPIEMADAYSTIARQGLRLPLRTIRFVTNDRGKIIAAGGDVKPVQVFPQRDVFLVTYLMRGVVDRGTGGSSRSLGFRKIAAGKTGTTNDKRDAWFIGFTPHTLALAWVGFDDNAPTGLSGSDAAVPMWARYMIAVTAGQPDDDFPTPERITFVDVDKTSGGRATQYCPPNVIIEEAFKSGTEPMQPCPIHLPQVVPMFDEFGNPIVTMTDTTGTIPPTDTITTMPPPATDTTLTGGVFRTDTTATTPLPAPATDTVTTTSPP